jgi:hypothetical protein
MDGGGATVDRCKVVGARVRVASASSWCARMPEVSAPGPRKVAPLNREFPAMVLHNTTSSKVSCTPVSCFSLS